MWCRVHDWFIKFSVDYQFEKQLEFWREKEALLVLDMELTYCIPNNGNLFQEQIPFKSELLTIPQRCFN